MRKTGIDVIGAVPWGTHFCQFYQTGQDLIEILVPYFREGLLQNDFCIWITCEPLTVAGAEAALRQAVRNLDDYLQRGQLEILDYSQWYAPQGKFDARSLMQRETDKEKNALARGYEGLRIAGNASWLDKQDWKDFSDYEAALNSAIGSRRMLALCAYSIETCDAYELIDVVSNHQFALMKQSGQWKVIESQRRRKIESDLRELEAFVRHSLTPLVFLDKDFNFIRVNDAYAKACQRDIEEFAGHNHFEFYPSAENEAIFREVVRTKQPYQAVAKPFRFPDHPEWGVTYWNWTLTPILNQKCEVDFLVFSLEDVTARVKAELALSQREKRYRSFTEATTEIIWTTNAAGEVVNDMPTWRKFTGQTLEEMRGWGWSNAVHPDDRQRTKAIWSEAVRTRRLYQTEYRLRRSDGTYRYMSARGVPVLDKDGSISEWVGTCVDISERRQMEEDLRKASLYARNLIEASLDPLVTISRNGQIMDVNKATEEVTGVARDRLIGSDFSAYFTDPKKADEGYQKVLAEGYVRDYPLTIRHISGKTTDVLYNATVYRGASGDVQGVFAAARDITEHKRMDEELHSLHAALERRAAQLQSLASELTLTEQRERRRLAQLLHDHLQQLLYAARLSISTIRRKVSDKSLQDMVQHLDMLLGKCIDESRSVTLELSPPVLYDAGLAPALEWLARQMQINFGLSVEVQTDAKAEPQAEDVKVLLFQSVRELLFNVVKHAGAKSARVKMALTPDEQVRVDVTDQGAGFDAQRVLTNGDRMPGFGLFSIRERLEQAGGRLELHTVAGEGTSVSLFAPYQEAKPAGNGHARAPVPAVVPPKGSAEEEADLGPARKIRVLLADDHTILRKGLVSVLNQEPDIEVIGEAADGEMAVELARQLNPDVVLMDVTMPKMDGIEATRRISSKQIDVSIIGFSAHKEEDMAQALYAAGAIAYLSKDEPTEFLIAAIRNVTPRATYFI